MPTQRTVPRGKGYDQRSLKKHLKALEAFSGSLPQFARKEGLQANALVVALETHFMARYRAYTALHGEPAERMCPGCAFSFVPNSASQIHCSRRCSVHARADEAYFGGKRKDTIGLQEGTCQLCGAKPRRGLQAHHVVGKENDPENCWLVALCAGCHKLVTDASRRLFLRDEAGWTRLKRLVELRVAGVLDENNTLW
jgi:5-methylcytosine-specific restriction endonuclease McrA